MKKWLYLSLVVIPLLVLGALFPVFASDQPPVHCTDTPEYCQTKVAQVPIPWQFWAVGTDTTGATTVIDRIRISPTWRLNAPVGQPVGEKDVFVSRWVAVVPGAGNSIPLNLLTWDFRTNTPLDPKVNEEYDLVWERIDPLEEPAPVYESEDLTLDINVSADDGAVLVAYAVTADADGTGPAVGHIINEAILAPTVNPAPGGPVVEILQIMVNFDVHNDTEFNVTNFELDFLGLDFTCEDVLWALGFVVGTAEPWGANEDNPLVVRPIEVTLEDGTVAKGTEVKWIQPDRPLEHCEWLHGGLMFDCADFDCFNNPDDPILRATVQGYWTVTVPCEGRMTGGGSVFAKGVGRVTHGFELHCDASQVPNNLEVNWGKGKKGANKFHLTELTWARCLDFPLINEAPPVAGFDAYLGFGKGRLNGEPGATILFGFSDEGEPGKNDRATMVIRDADGNVVLTVLVAKLKNGNHQAHAH
jgi:hypothetical protein